MPQSLSKAVVLIIEDNLDDRYVIETLLLKYGGFAYYKPNGQIWGDALLRCINTYALIRLDLILLDLELPHLDGFAMLREIRKSPLLGATKVVAITANASQRERAQAAGFDSFLAKPLSFQHFPQHIQRILDGEAIWDDTSASLGG
jgi:two-component system cell cycle response regulator DivK